MWPRIHWNCSFFILIGHFEASPVLYASVSMFSKLWVHESCNWTIWPKISYFFKKMWDVCTLSLTKLATLAFWNTNENVIWLRNLCCELSLSHYSYGTTEMSIVAIWFLQVVTGLASPFWRLVIRLVLRSEPQIIEFWTTRRSEPKWNPKFWSTRRSEPKWNSKFWSTSRDGPNIWPKRLGPRAYYEPSLGSFQL